MISHTDFDELPTIRAWQGIKDIMYEAAALTRDKLQGSEYHRQAHPDAPITRMYLFRSMARALWRNDVCTASRLIATSPLAASHLVVSDGIVGLLSPPTFHAQCDAVNDEWHQLRALQASTNASQYDEFGRHKDVFFQRKIERKAARRARLWTPWARQIRLEGVRVHVHDGPTASEVTVCTDEGIFQAVQQHWQPVFAAQEACDEDISRFLHSVLPPAPTFDAPLPSVAALTHAIQRAKP
eukprot:9331383-Pyramimonas_sp.AAC.1